MKILKIACSFAIHCCLAAPGTDALADCTPGPAVEYVADAVDPEQCAAEGGHVETLGMAEIATCVTPYADGGKRCNSSSECVGRCFAFDSTADGAHPVVGYCQHDVSEEFGCFSEVLGNTATGRICVD